MNLKDYKVKGIVKDANQKDSREKDSWVFSR